MDTDGGGWTVSHGAWAVAPGRGPFSAQATLALLAHRTGELRWPPHPQRQKPLTPKTEQTKADGCKARGLVPIS